MRALAALLCVLLGASCASSTVPPAAEPGAARVVATPLGNAAPPGSDAVPLYQLVFEYPSGARVPVAEPASAYAPFRDGVALIDRQRRLLLVSPDGSSRLLAASTATTPTRGPSGELYYAALYGGIAELHRLTETGRDRVIARQTSSVALIAPQADHSVLFVGARSGGVAGIWHVASEASAARCLTNCLLRTGEPWGETYEPPPGTATELEARYRDLPKVPGELAPEVEGGTLRGEP